MMRGPDRCRFCQTWSGSPGIGGFFFRATGSRGAGDLVRGAAWGEDPVPMYVWGGACVALQEEGVTVFAPFPQDSEGIGLPEHTWIINFRVDDLDAGRRAAAKRGGNGRRGPGALPERALRRGSVIRRAMASNFGSRWVPPSPPGAVDQGISRARRGGDRGSIQLFIQLDLLRGDSHDHHYHHQHHPKRLTPASASASATRVGDINVHYVEAGDGPLVVLLHGFPEFWYGWRGRSSRSLKRASGSSRPTCAATTCRRSWTASPSTRPTSWPRTSAASSANSVSSPRWSSATTGAAASRGRWQ